LARWPIALLNWPQLREFVFPEPLNAKRKLREKATQLRNDQLREDFGRKSFAARISPDFVENNCVYAKSSDRCDSNPAVRFGQTANRTKSVWFTSAECQRARTR
jgi:hypothetical protein